MSDEGVMSNSEMGRLSRLLAKVQTLADDLAQPADPRNCLQGIRQLLAEYDSEPVADDAPWTDRRRKSCPSWCTEHYTADDGSRNHSSYPRAVTGASAEDDTPVMVSTWVELREGDGERRAVGILEKIQKVDAELSHCQLRELARHLLAVAEQVEAIEGGRS